jgi:hypothetical protein
MLLCDCVADKNGRLLGKAVGDALAVERSDVWLLGFVVGEEGNGRYPPV